MESKGPACFFFSVAHIIPLLMWVKDSKFDGPITLIYILLETNILLMEEILHPLGCIKPCK